MLELTGIGSVLRGVSLLYWLVALGCLLAALWFPKSKALKGLIFVVVAAAFGYLPVTGYIEQQKREAYAREAWAYFKKKCETEAGEKIYKTFTGVKSVLVVKPLPPATEKDLFDQYWYGDPYSSSRYGDDRGLNAAKGILIARRVSGPPGVSARGFEVVEIQQTNGGKTSVVQLSRQQANAETNYSEARLTEATQVQSKFGISWEDISNPEDRKYWVAGSRLSVFDLRDNSVIAERIGYYIEAGFGSKGGARTPWLTSKGRDTTCPVMHTFADQDFVFRVLGPNGG